jgi:tetratricopeptide (TPR) repeat protein
MINGQRSSERIVAREIEAICNEIVPEGLPGTGAQPPIGRLAQEILKALAFIGLPTEGEVLLSVPAVRRELAQITIYRHPKTIRSARPPSATTLLGREDVPPCFLSALNLLIERNLVGVIEAHGTAGDTATPRPINPNDRAPHAIGQRYRFVLHRLVSKVIRDRFDVPMSETVLSDTFNLSLYAAQPDDAPAFTPEITSDIEQLVDHLINAYKDVSLAPALRERLERVTTQSLRTDVYSTHALTPELLTRVQRYTRAIQVLDPLVPAALRAAGGVIRGFFSSVNLLGLDLGDPLSRTDDLAVIGVHKKRIRRLLDLTLEAEATRSAYAAGPHKLNERLAGMFEICTRVSKPHSDRDGRRIMADIRSRVDQPENWPGKSSDAFAAWQDLDRGLECHGDDLLVKPQAGVATELQPLLHRLDKTLAGQPAMRGHLRDGAALKTFPLYKEEIVWLYNERGMLSLAQGDLYIASTTFQLALEANARIEGDRYHPNRCRLLLNRSLLWIERGKIAEARRCLIDLEAGIGSTPDAVTRDSHEGRLILAIAKGYLGLCDQLNGFVQRASKSYRTALLHLGELREQRAIATFELHLGSLLQTHMKDRDEAAACFARAVAAAEGGRHTDILYRTRVAQAHNDRIRGKISAAVSRAILSRAIEYGEKLDMHRVRVEALSTSIQLRLEVGDVDAAAMDCAHALALASQYGMTLRRIWLRVMSGKVYRERNDLPNARFMFEGAIEAAERIGFQRAIEDASSNLMSMPHE